MYVKPIVSLSLGLIFATFNKTLDKLSKADDDKELIKL